MNRRLLLKRLGYLGLLTAASPALPDVINKHPNLSASAQDQLSVNYEWGELKEVVVGYPYFLIGGPLPKVAENYYHPSNEFANLGALWSILTPKMPFEEFAPQLWEEQKQQMDAVIKILKSRGVTVHQVEKINSQELAFEENIGPSCLQQFPRDPILVIGNEYIELPMFMPSRRKERFPIRRTLQSRLNHLGASITSAPEPFPISEDASGGFGPSAFLEGGDIFLIGKDIYVGNTGNASNILGIEWLQKRLGMQYRVHEVKMNKQFLHLDCALCTPRPGLAIVCLEAFPDGLPEFIKGWQLIEVSAEDAEQKLACNGLVLDQKNIIIGEDSPKLAEDLTRAGQNVYVSPFDKVAALGGGFRCWHHPLIRV